MNTLENDLKQARETLETLQAELPNFHGLLTDNEKEAQQLRKKRASLDEQAAAKNRVMVAREMLEQHQSDIQTAKNEVEKLEAAYAHEEAIRTLTAHAKAAARHRNAFETALVEANKVLLEHTQKLVDAAEQLDAEQRAFVAAGEPLSRAFYTTFWSYTMTQERINEEVAKADAILEAVQARGVDTDAALSPLEGHRRSVLEPTEVRMLAQPQPFSRLLYQALEIHRQHRG